MVEHGPEKAGVPSSSLGLGTISSPKLSDKSSNERYLASSHCAQHGNCVLSLARQNSVVKHIPPPAVPGVRGDNPVENCLEKAPKGHFAVDKSVVRSTGRMEETTHRPRDLLDPHVVHKQVVADKHLGLSVFWIIHRRGQHIAEVSCARRLSKAGPAGGDSCPRPTGSGSRLAAGHASRGTYRPRPASASGRRTLDPGARSSIRSGW